jgi:hypothetical protein
MWWWCIQWGIWGFGSAFTVAVGEAGVTSVGESGGSEIVEERSDCTRDGQLEGAKE